MKTFKQFILTETPPPEDWDRNIFKSSYRKQLTYALERAKKIGSGSSRVVFEIMYEGRPTVLKIAKNPKGLAQNQKESDYGLYRMYPDITCPLIDYDEEHDEPKWVHLEKANKLSKSIFKSIEGFSFDDFGYMLRDDEQRRNGRKGKGFETNWEAQVNDEKEIEKIRESEIFYDVTSLLGNFDILAGDLQRLANWGIFRNHPVIIDLGFDSSIAKSHYGFKV
jgi:predicted Ser/Thr protein kinase